MEAWIVISLLIIAVIAFATEKISVDLVTLGMLCVLVLCGILRVDQAFAGFGDRVIVLLEGVGMALAFGDRPEVRYPAAREWLDAHGYASTLDYVATAAQAVLRETRPKRPAPRRKRQKMRLRPQPHRRLLERCRVPQQRRHPQPWWW